MVYLCQQGHPLLVNKVNDCWSTRSIWCQLGQLGQLGVHSPWSSWAQTLEGPSRPSSCCTSVSWAGEWRHWKKRKYKPAAIEPARNGLNILKKQKRWSKIEPAHKSHRQKEGPGRLQSDKSQRWRSDEHLWEVEIISYKTWQLEKELK